MSLKDAIVYPRIHHQLIPNVVLHEPALSQKYVTGLEKRGHILISTDELAVVQAIHVDEQHKIQAVSDPRKGGKPAGY